jgi:hypothetical protein
MAEESFFRYFADKNVPLVFVFTKYDKLVTTYLAESFQATGSLTAAATRESEQKAQEYVANIRDKLESTIGKGVTVQAVDDKSELTRAGRRVIFEKLTPRIQITNASIPSSGRP